MIFNKRRTKQSEPKHELKCLGSLCYIKVQGAIRI